MAGWARLPVIPLVTLQETVSDIWRLAELTAE
jgi:hypothetical protein